jgi:hypothetical protein
MLIVGLKRKRFFHFHEKRKLSENEQDFAKISVSRKRKLFEKTSVSRKRKLFEKTSVFAEVTTKMLHFNINLSAGLGLPSHLF